MQLMGDFVNAEDLLQFEAFLDGPTKPAVEASLDRRRIRRWAW